MQVSDLTIEVRDTSLKRVGQLQPEDLNGFTAMLRYNAIGSWKLTLPVGHVLGELLGTPGYGIIVTTSQGVLLSGPVISVVTSQDTSNPDGSYEITGVDDSIVLSDRLAYPTPTTADVAAQTTEKDTRSGIAEDVMKAYVAANIGPTAPAVRQVPGLTVETSLGRGTTVTASARFESLYEILKPLADVSGLGFTVEQVGSGLQFQVYQPTDRTANIRLDLQNGRLTKTEYSFTQPKLTRTIVGGSGDGVARVFLERTTADSAAAETLWGRRIEVFTDARNTAVPAELQQAGDEALATDGKTIVSVSLTPSDDQTMLFGVDWNLGDRVSVVVGSDQVAAIVTEVGILIDSDGVRIGATIGEPYTQDYESQLIARQLDMDERISNLERIK